MRRSFSLRPKGRKGGNDKNNKFISLGYNSRRPLFLGQRGTTHAEMDAISRLPYNKKKKKTVDLIVLRISKNGKDISDSHPCRNCAFNLTNIHGYNVRHIYYSNKDGVIVKATLSDIISRAVKSRGHYALGMGVDNLSFKKSSIHFEYTPTVYHYEIKPLTLINISQYL